MSQTLADDSEVMFGQQEEIAGAMEMEGSAQNRRGRETWLEDTEPYRGARPRMRYFDRPVDGELGATLGDVEKTHHLWRCWRRLWVECSATWRNCSQKIAF